MGDRLHCGAASEGEGAPVPVDAFPVEGIAVLPSCFFSIAIPLAVLPGRLIPVAVAAVPGPALELPVGNRLALVSGECVTGLALREDPAEGRPWVLLGTVAPVSGTGTPLLAFEA
jgi:hypothetical protein